MNIDDFGKKFIEIYSFEGNQDGNKVCKWCRHHSQKFTEDEKEKLKGDIPEYISKNGFGKCKIGNKKEKQAGVKDRELPLITADNGVCILFSVSILKHIIRIFRGE